MAKKKVAAVVKIQIPAGQATPAPPVGTALGPHGVAIMDFCKAYNAATENQRGTIVPVEITIFEDRSFTFILKTPPTAVLLREAAGIAKGSQNPGKEGAGSVPESKIVSAIQTLGSLSQKALRLRLGLDRPIYAVTSAYGHFGREPGPDGSFSWEKTDAVDALIHAVT